MIAETWDVMTYREGMDELDPTTLNTVLDAVKAYDPDSYTSADVERALANDECSLEDFKALLSPAAEPYIEEMAQKAQAITRARFGNSVSLFTPLYIANYCDNGCIYCGFNCSNKIKRSALSHDDLVKELDTIAATGLQDILILTGESQRMSSVEWIGEAIKLAAERFSTVGIEIYPANVADYKYLHECGADFVTVFQETYNPDKYETLHLMGHKRVWPYRFEAQERALMGGMRGVGFSALLGLDDFRKDALATALHVYYLQRKYPHAEMSLSCPRLRPIINNDKINPKDVHETQLCQILCAYRIFLPYAGITVSSREVARFRDHIIRFAATKISAGVSTGIGDHEEKYTGKENEAESGDEQFEIADNRSLQEIYDAIKDQGLQPVLNEYIYV